MSRYLGGATPLAIAHRGGAGIGRENMLETFQRSCAAGVSYLETDVRITADGVCLAFHDAVLSRITGADGKIAELTHEGVRRLGVGGGLIPRIEDLLEALPEARFVMDLKDSRALAPLIGLLRARGDLDRVALSGARDRWLTAARTMAGPALTTALGWESTTRLVMAARTGICLREARRSGLRGEFLHVPWRFGRAGLVSDRLVAMAHDLGLRLVVWTVNDAGLMHELLDRGVDGIITDRPDLLRKVVDQRAGLITLPEAPEPVRRTDGQTIPETVSQTVRQTPGLDVVAPVPGAPPADVLAEVPRVSRVDVAGDFVDVAS